MKRHCERNIIFLFNKVGRSTGYSLRVKNKKDKKMESDKKIRGICFRSPVRTVIKLFTHQSRSTLRRL